ncbi:hypothetical protein MKW94_024169 [Papaver nudicaule]|uniref:MULE transposase domain-containing protein n=1 Tax=Papaver nudicaule TaxID=74823 RepID=A0AA41VKB5_PAPNU|nr:hypothetical protein [Papaver nudicaule]
MSTFGTDPKVDMFCESHVYYKRNHISYMVSLQSTIADLKWVICNNWRMLSPSSIVVNYMQNGVKIPVLADVSLHGLAALHSTLKSPFFELHVDSFEAGASSSFVDADNNSELVQMAKKSYIVEGNEVEKSFISDSWANIFDDTHQFFHGGVESVRIALDKYCLRTGYKLKKVKNELSRLTYKCISKPNFECSWHLHTVAVDKSNEVFKIKKYVKRHTCGVGMRVRSPTVKKRLVDHMIHERVMHNPLIKSHDIIDYFKLDVGVNIKYHHAYNGLEVSQDAIFGDEVKSYTHLTWYVTAIRDTNPGSYVDFDYNDATKRFHRLFICFGACKEGYRLCRPMIFCDATFLTGRFRGTLMAATCLNGDNEFYPLAYALVPGENIDHWTWFMKNLKKVVDDREITFITDRGEGLKRSIPEVFGSQAHHSYCFFHLKQNLPINKGHEKYKQVIECYRKATYALSPLRYDEALRELEIMGCGWVANYLKGVEKEKWSSAYFPGCRYGYVSSSIAESFNNWIRKEKKLPAFALIDITRYAFFLMRNNFFSHICTASQTYIC